MRHIFNEYPFIKMIFNKHSFLNGKKSQMNSVNIYVYTNDETKYVLYK